MRYVLLDSSKVSLPPVLLLALLPVVLLGQIQQEEAWDWYKEWLEVDVKYIVTAEERDIFLKLTSEEERDAFIEQFWLRRDSDTSTSFNEFKEEHYRRIAYANDHFKSGIPGWATDRGRIYIMFGPPDERRTHQGGHYRREAYEGGGFTQAFPFEVWRYDYIEGVGSEVEIEFVDPTMTGEFRIAMNSDEKDALLHVSGLGGMTWSELSGDSTKGDRILNQTLADPINRKMYTGRVQDLPFERLLRLYKLSRPPEIRYKDLQKIVTAKVQYNQLPFDFAAHHIRLAGEQFLVPITLSIEDSQLGFAAASGTPKATIDVYGIVTSLAGRTVYEFEDTVSTPLTDSRVYGDRQHSVYQKKIVLQPGLYKLTLVVRDSVSEKIGVTERRLSVPSVNSDELSLSSVFLARSIEPVQDPERLTAPFVIGPYKVIPRLESCFSHSQPLQLYFEIYNSQVDEASQQAAFRLLYTIRNSEGEIVNEVEDRSSPILLGDRAIVAQGFLLDHYQPGGYLLEISVSDLVGGKSTLASLGFQVEGTPP